MNKTFYTLVTTVVFLIGISYNCAYSQCTDWLNPTSNTGWDFFDGSFGGAPCDDGSGCSLNALEFTEIGASQAFSVANFVEGGEYAFSLCNGPGAGNWVPEFTIIAPSGAFDAFGAGDGDGCTISWTASESGSYFIVINEAGECGGGENTLVANGTPALMCLSSIPCPVIDSTTCNAGVMTTIGSISLCNPKQTFDLIAENTIIPEGTEYSWSITNDLGGTGGFGPIFLGGLEPEVTFDADLGGLLSYYGFEPLVGTWVFRGGLFDIVGNFCSITEDSLVVFFGENGPSLTSIESNDVDALTVNVTGGELPYSYLWSDANAQTTQTAVGLVPGSYTVTVIDATGCQAIGDFSFLVSTNSISSLRELSISPSPTTGAFSVQLALEKNDLVKIEVLDNVGRVIRTSEKEVITDRFEFDLHDSTSGVYFVRITAGAESIIKKIVVNK